MSHTILLKEWKEGIYDVGEVYVDKTFESK